MSSDRRAASKVVVHPHDAELFMRRRALDPERSFIVQAPAGSGKTELLIRRYLSLLVRVDEPEEIVAVTFTRKAAAEMQTRVIAALAAANRREINSELDELIGLGQAALQRDRERQWRLLLHPARLRITTIDALCASIVHRMPWSSRFGASPAVIEDATPLYREAARATLRLLETGAGEWSRAVETLLERFDNDLRRIELLLVGMLHHRDQWIRHMIDRHEDMAVQRATLQADWEWVVCRELAKARAAVPAQYTAELAACAGHAVAVSRGEEYDPNQSPNASDLPGQRATDLPAWRALASALLTKSGKWRTNAERAPGFGSGQVSESMRSRLNTLLEGLEEHSDLLHCLQAVLTLPEPEIGEARWQNLAALYELLPLAVAELQLVFQSSGQVDFSEIAQRAALALGVPLAPTDLALALDYRIQHILVDEFQDTSYTQLDLLERLTAGWSEGDGRTLFLVGDPMQSIYRFREAEVGVFLSIARSGFGSIAIEPLTLTANFRSHVGIVDWINHTFAQTLPSEVDVERGAVPFTASSAVSSEASGSTPTIHAQGIYDAASEARWIVNVINQERARDREQTIAVLVRSRSHVDAVIPALRRAGIHFHGVELESLAERPAVLDLMALTRALLHLGDSVAWFAVLRAPWCGLTLADLTPLNTNSQRRCVWQRLHDVDVETCLSQDGHLRVNRVRAVLSDVLANRHRRPLRRWIEGAWIALGGPACIDGTDLRNVESFFEVLETQDVGGDILDFETLRDAVRGLWASPDLEADGKLQLMTIHKAKGLEFDTVIVPGLGRRTRSSDQPLLLWSELAGDWGGSRHLLLAPLASQHQDSMYTYLRGLENEKEKREAGRLLYVACTRAARSLYLSGHMNRRRNGTLGQPAQGTLLAHLWPSAASHFETAPTRLAASYPATRAEAPRISYLRLPAGWVAPPVPEPAAMMSSPARLIAEIPVEFSWAGHTARHIGILVHEAIQQIVSDGFDRWAPNLIDDHRPRWQARLLAAGVPRGELKPALDRIAQAIGNTLADSRGRWILGVIHQDAHTEWALSGWIDDQWVNVVLDRTFVDKGIRWIVDFKTGSHEGSDPGRFLDREVKRYQPQLNQYAATVASFESRPIRLGLYFPLLSQWREWGFEP